MPPERRVGFFYGMKINRILKNNFTQIINEIIIDPNIGAGAFRLYVYILSKPDNWKFNNREIMERLKIKDSGTIAKYWKELIFAGWVSRQPERTKAGTLRGRYEYYIFDQKQTVKENEPNAGKTRIREKPEYGKNPHHSNTNNYSNTNNSNNTEKPTNKNSSVARENNIGIIDFEKTESNEQSVKTKKQKTKKPAAQKNKKLTAWEYHKTNKTKISVFANLENAGDPDFANVDEPFTDKQKKYIETAVAFWLQIRQNADEMEIPTRTTDAANFSWVDTVRKMYELDGITRDHLRAAFSVLKKDAFWKDKILSVDALRNKNKSGVMKIETIIAQSKRPTKQTGGKSNANEVLREALANMQQKDPETFESSMRGINARQ